MLSSTAIGSGVWAGGIPGIGFLPRHCGVTAEAATPDTEDAVIACVPERWDHGGRGILRRCFCLPARGVLGYGLLAG